VSLFVSRLLFRGELVLWSSLLLLCACAPVDRWQVFDASNTGSELPAAPAVIDSRPELPKPILPATIDDVDVPQQLSLEQAVLLALHNNRDLRVRQFEPVISGTFEKIERGRFDPELFAEMEYFKEESSETSRSTGEQFGVLAKENTELAGIRQYLPTGTALEAFVEHQRNNSNRAPEQQEARLGLTVTQSLLRGFGPTVNLASVRRAELDSLASADELRGFTESLLAETEIAYWRYVLAGREIEIFEESLDVARKQLEEVEVRIEVGILPDIEAAAARTERALTEQALINARSLLEERRLRLLWLISPDPSAGFDRPFIADSELMIGAEPITDLEKRLLLAEKSRADLSEARRRLQQNRLETVVTRNGVLPRLELFIALGKTGYAESFSKAFRELDGNTYDYSVGLRLSHYLGNRSAEARRLAASAQRSQASEAVINLSHLIQLDVRLAVNEVERTRQQIAASRATRTFQEQTLAAERERFDVGASTALEVALAQRDLLKSRIVEIESIVNFRTALIELYLAEGSLLARRGISLAETL